MIQTMNKSKSYEDFVRAFVEGESKSKVHCKDMKRNAILVSLLLGFILVILTSYTKIFPPLLNSILFYIGIMLSASILAVFWELYQYILRNEHFDAPSDMILW